MNEKTSKVWSMDKTYQLGISVYIVLSDSRLEEEKEYKIEDNPWVFGKVICFYEWWYYKINYKCERCKHTKTKFCYKNVDSFVVFPSIFLLCGDLKFDLMFFIQLIWWIRTHQIFKKFDQAKIFLILLYTLSNLFTLTNLIKLIWPCISGDISIVDWLK